MARATGDKNKLVIIDFEQNRCAMAVVSHVAVILFFKVEVPESKCSYPFTVIESGCL